MNELSGDYIAGFVDGEGCFALKFRRDIKYKRKNKPAYFYWDIEFAIMLKGDDKEILERIQNTLNCGKLGNIDKRGTIRYAVNDINDITDKIVPFLKSINCRQRSVLILNYGRKRQKFLEETKRQDEIT